MTPQSQDMQDEVNESVKLLEADEVEPITKTQEKETEDDGVDISEERGETEETEEQPEKPEEKPEDSEEVKEEVKPRHRPTVKDIQVKYPNFFKEFPDMRHVLFRENEYASVFPTVDDAKKASENSQEFERFQELLTSGTEKDMEEFVSGVKSVDGLTSLAGNFLPALYKNDRDLYFKVTAPIAETMLRNAYKSGNEDVMNSALHIALWAFGDQRYATGDLRSEPVTKREESSVDKERREFYNERYNSTKIDIAMRGNQKLRADIKRDLDPNGVFNEFTSDLLIKDIMSKVGEALEQDARHMNTMNSLWKQAYKAGFSGNWNDRILTAYLSGAKTVMPAIRASVRSKALNQQKINSEETERIATKSIERKEISPSASSSRANREPKSNEIDWSRTSDLDFLNGKITLKRK